jgi:hypothetical protein
MQKNRWSGWPLTTECVVTVAGALRGLSLRVVGVAGDYALGELVLCVPGEFDYRVAYRSSLVRLRRLTSVPCLSVSVSTPSETVTFPSKW